LEYFASEQSHSQNQGEAQADYGCDQARGAVAALVPLWCGSDALPLCAAANRCAIMDDYGVTTLWHFDNGGVVRTFGAVILGEFSNGGGQPGHGHRVELRVKIGLTAKDLCCESDIP